VGNRSVEVWEKIKDSSNGGLGWRLQEMPRHHRTSRACRPETLYALPGIPKIAYFDDEEATWLSGQEQSDSDTAAIYIPVIQPGRDRFDC
jgi:hypothetical protein